jgi:hypothetical protein
VQIGPHIGAASMPAELLGHRDHPRAISAV